MAKTRIQWADFTFNHVRGCTKVAPGCENCYASDLSKRNPKTLGIWGPNGKRVVAAESYWNDPIKWNRRCEKECFVQCAGCGHRSFLPEHLHESFCDECGDPVGEAARPRVFCASLADVFEDWQGPIVNHHGQHLVHGRDGWIPEDCEQAESCSRVTMDDVRRRLFKLIDDTPHLEWQLLTKRPENIPRMIPGRASCASWPNCTHPDCVADHHYENVWLGCSVSDQETADKAIPQLLRSYQLAGKLFISAEPLLGPIKLQKSATRACPNGDCFDQDGRRLVVDSEEGGLLVECICSRLNHIDLVIAGGESGHGSRRCDLQWIRNIVQQCQAADTAVFVKQLGSNAGRLLSPKGDREGDHLAWCPWTTKDKKGGDPEEWPEDLRVREMPNAIGRSRPLANQP